MTSLKRFKSMESFCLELETSANEVLHRNLFSPTSTSKGWSRQYMGDTFNSNLRKEPAVPKREEVSCYSPFCQEMQKLISEGLWIQNRVNIRKLESVRSNQNERTKLYDKETTPTFRLQARHNEAMRAKKKQNKHSHKSTYRDSDLDDRVVISRDSQKNRNLREYQSEIKQIQQHSKRLKQQLQRLQASSQQKQKLKKTVNQTGNSVHNAEKQLELRHRSIKRQQKIRNLLQDIGVPLNQLQSSSYKARPQEMTSYQ